MVEDARAREIEARADDLVVPGVLAKELVLSAAAGSCTGAVFTARLKGEEVITDPARRSDRRFFRRCWRRRASPRKRPRKPTADHTTVPTFIRDRMVHRPAALEHWLEASKGLSGSCRRSRATAERVHCPCLGSLAGRAAGPTRGAEYHDRFFTLWRMPIPDVPLLIRAREEFAKLPAQ